MRGPHLLRVEESAGRFGSLVAAATTEGIRVGWLDLREAPVPTSLQEAAGLGVLRAVAAGGDRTVAVKRHRGQVVLRDLLREHFLGCGLVLVAAGPPEMALLEVDGSGWRLTPAAGRPRQLTTERLVALLRRPHPFGSAAPQSRRQDGGG